MHRHRDEAFGLADDLPFFDPIPFLHARFGRGADMLGEGNDELFGQRAALDRLVRRPLFVVGRMQAAGEGFKSHRIDSEKVWGYKSCRLQLSAIGYRLRLSLESES